jgi:hypothetical protein
LRISENPWQENYEKRNVQKRNIYAVAAARLSLFAGHALVVFRSVTPVWKKTFGA